MPVRRAKDPSSPGRWGMAVVRGRSMRPTLADGDRLLADYRGESRPGRVAVVRLPGGVVAVDNAIWSGRIADPEADDPSTDAIRRTVTALASDERVHASLLPIGDGLMLATRRR